jgi:tRNA(adenine34) deaminase
MEAGRLHYFITLEPCPMCAGAIINARITTLVYAPRTKTQARAQASSIFSRNATTPPRDIRRVLEKESAALLSEFFRKLSNNCF